MHYRYHYLVCFDNGRRNEHYFLGAQLDILPVWEERMIQGRTDPIGSLWGTYTEIWMEGAHFAFRLCPLDDATAARTLFEYMHRGAVPPVEHFNQGEQRWQYEKTSGPRSSAASNST